MKKILSLDGGGIRGLIPLTIVTEIEERIGQPAHAIFDLIAGTSTGGVAALFLTIPDENGDPLYTAADGANILANRGHEFFSKSFWKDISSLAGLTDEKNASESIENIYQEHFGETTMATSLTKSLVTSYQLESRHPYIFKSWHERTRGVKLKHVARATSAAPTYFTPAIFPVQGEEYSFIDGGVFANNPAMCAYAEARRLWPDEDEMMIVSIGTGEMTKPIPYADAKDWGLAEWAVPILTVVFDGVNDAIDYQLRTILGEGYYRFQKPLTVASEALDDYDPQNVAALRQEAHLLMQERAADLDRVCQLLRQ